MARLDPHSYADSSQPRTKSFDWTACVDFSAHVIYAEVVLHFEENASGPLDLDTRALAIDSVLDANGAAIPFVLHPPEPILGSRLAITLAPGTASIRIRYRTSPEASALQWLTPEQTLGKKQPYLFSQCQALHARSVLPCQDTPAIRQAFTASIKVPAALRAVMGAAAIERVVDGDSAIERFAMAQPIPPYLFAFAVGDLGSKDLSPRTRLWTEPAQLASAAWEFEHVEDQMKAAESLFGNYDWERFDLLVMPPSFPYGGMENPRLTFLTPSLIAGDRSQVFVVAHELAHSWTGNLVTNANAEHFWLNEGFTVFAERRILEATDGPEMASLQAAIGYQKLLQAFEQLSAQPALTKLRTHLAGIDPDDAYSQVPYEKGYLFLKALEQAAGRKAFDDLLAQWLGAHRFGAATTDDFLETVERVLPGLLAKVDASTWIDGPGLPTSYWKPESARLAAVESVGARVPTLEEAKPWSPTEWQLYLEALPKPSPHETCESLDERFHLDESKNPEILVAWLVVACSSGYGPAIPRASTFLARFGRMKYLKPLYRALASRPETKQLARDLFEKLSDTYHPIARQGLRSVVA